MTEQPQRSQLELYEQVLSAYQQAGPWHLIFKHTFKRQWWRVIVTGVVIIAVAVLAYRALAWSSMSPYDRIVVIVILLSLLFFGYMFLIIRKLEKYFKEDIINYRILFETYRAGWEFYRYLCFRAELCKFRVEDINQVNPWIAFEQQSLGTYIARNPVVSWIYATSGAVIAASATNWPNNILISVISFSFLALVILHVIPTLITNQRRQYELHRWLAWYKAEASKPTTVTSDGANPLLN